jgi:hypothetical protein
MNQSKKYNRTLHAQISLGTTSDDRMMPNGYVKVFAEMDNLVLTEKLDGQNNCFNKYGVFARSHAVVSQLPWDKPLLERWELIKNSLGELEIFGENLYGIHSIGYHKLESFFYVFAIRMGQQWLSWEEVKFYANLLDFPTVPEVSIKISLKEFYNANLNTNTNENKLLENWFIENLGMTWEASTNTPGLLGGYDLTTNDEASEGFVLRNTNSFIANDGDIPVADNEFNNLLKVVRPAHVKTDEHWSKNWSKASLINYEKYNWFNYNFKSKT